MAEDLDRDYEAAGFKGRLGFGTAPALVVVDFVKAYLDPGSPLYALSVFDQGSQLGDVPAELEPHPDELTITKQYASAFFGTSLASTLNALGVDTVLIIGLSTSGCVRASAVDALQLGFIPVVVREAVGDRDERVHEANLFDLEAKYADVVSEDEILAWLSEREPAAPGS